MLAKLRLFVAITAAIVSTGLTFYLVVCTYKYFDLVSDLPEYVVAGHLLAEGRGKQLYNGDAVISERKKLFPTLRDRPGLSVMSPPPAFPLFVPFAFLPVDVMKLIWQPILALATCASILILRKAYALSAIETGWLWAVTFCMGPLFEAMKLGQITTILMLALTSSIFLFKRSKDFSAGAVLAIFVLKPQELITFMLFLIGAGRWQAIKGFSTMMALLALVSACAVGLGIYADFFTFMRSLKSLNSAMQPELTPTLRGQLMRLSLDFDTVQIISLVVLLAACVFSFWWGRRQAKNVGWLESGVAVTLPLGLSTAMLVHFYDLMLLIPVSISLIRSPLAKKIPELFTPLAMLMIVSFMLPCSIFIHYKCVLGNLPPNPYAIMMLSASALLVFFAFKNQSELQPPPNA